MHSSPTWMLATIPAIIVLLAALLLGSRRHGSLRHLTWRWNLLFILASLGFLAFYSVQTYQQQVSLRTQQIEEEFLRQAREQIRLRASFIHALILDEKQRAEKQLKDDLRHTVIQAVDLAEALIERYKDRLTRAEVTELIIETLRPLRNKNGRGYLFATRLDGTKLLFADRPEFEGHNMLDMQDQDGVFYVHEMIRLSRQQGKGFVDYRISQPGKTGWQHKKIAYIHYVPELNAFIGTGEYVESFEKELRQNILGKLDRLVEDGPLSIFGATYSGISLFGPGKGKNVLDIQDHNGAFVVRELIRKAKEGGGFVRYQMPASLGEGLYEKISYCLPLPMWNSYVGAGIDLGFVENNIARARREMYATMRQQLIQGAVFILLLGALLWVVGQRLSRSIKRNVSRLNQGLEAVAVDGRAISLDEIQFDEFIAIGETANRMLKQRRQAEEKLTWLAHYDALTGLVNRYHAKERLDHLLKTPSLTGQRWLLMFDINRFKRINEIHGHALADRVLVEFATRLQSLKPQPELAARLSSNEFILVIDQEDAADIFTIVQGFKEELCKPMPFEATRLVIDTRISAVQCHQARTSSELLHRADIALLEIKEHPNTQGFMCYDERLDKIYQENLQLEKALRSSLQSPEQFQLEFQPIWSLKHQALKGFEALVRWHHPTLGRISPGRFIPLAEKRAMIVPLGQIIFNRACETLSQWLQHYPVVQQGVVRLSVNMAPQQFITENFIEEIRTALQHWQLPPEILCIEITETSLMEEPELAIQRIRALKEMGISISIDDFGTGYSSLSYLQQFDVDIIKLDRSLVVNIVVTRSAQRIIDAVVRLGHDLDLEIVAEGVETLEQLHTLHDLDCDAVQGFLTGKPSADAVAQSWLDAPEEFPLSRLD
jgi:diguanylate cyclase (GGDEF)-like protein